MRYSAASKFEISRIIEESVLGIRRTCEQLGISRSTFYNWYDRYLSPSSTNCSASSVRR